MRYSADSVSISASFEVNRHYQDQPAAAAAVRDASSCPEQDCIRYGPIYVPSEPPTEIQWKERHSQDAAKSYLKFLELGLGVLISAVLVRMKLQREHLVLGLDLLHLEGNRACNTSLHSLPVLFLCPVHHVSTVEISSCTLLFAELKCSCWDWSRLI